MPPHNGQSVHEEESLGKVYDSKIMQKILPYARPYLRWLISAFIIASIISGTEILMPYLTKRGIDQYIIFSGKVINLSKITESQASQLKTRYQKNLIAIDDTHIAIKEGLLDPSDRKLLTTSQALDTEIYYVLDIHRYAKQDVERIQTLIKAKPELFKLTKSDATYLIDSKTFSLLESTDRSLLRQPDKSGVTNIALLYLGILVISFFLTYGQAYLMTWIGQKIMFDIRMDLFNHIQRQPIQFFTSQPTGRLVTRTTNDVNTLNELFTSILVDIFTNVLKLVGIIVAMVLMAPRLAVATYTLLPIIILATWYFKRRMRDAFRAVRIKIALINATLSEHLSGVRVIQTFAREQIHFDKFRKINHDYYKANIYQLIVQSLFSPIIVFVENLGIALILYYGGGQIIQSSISLGTLVAFLSYVSMFFAPVRDIAEKFNIMQSAMASSERILQILEKPTEYAQENPQPDDHSTPINGSIEFKNVWFAYAGEDWVLKDVSFTIKAGETVAFVGATGSGKTTIINLLSKFFTIQKGAILIDDRNIDAYRRHDLRRGMAVVLQDVFLFAGDIRRNIRLNETSISDERIENVASVVRADQFIQKLPQKYDQLLTEGGTTLSQGQRQLLAFARALAFDPRILVLDEATASIDSETEWLIQKALDEIIKTRTSVIIAHRLSTIKKANKIIVMHKGRIVEEGDHDSLLAKRGFYYKLYLLQFKSQETSSGQTAA